VHELIAIIKTAQTPQRMKIRFIKSCFYLFKLRIKTGVKNHTMGKQREWIVFHCFTVFKNEIYKAVHHYLTKTQAYEKSSTRSLINGLPPIRLQQ
jgi:DNA integrity scanning protein DisA with diadenylate cyclase activity